MSDTLPEHLQQWQPFSVRYGLVDHDNQTWHDKHPWGSRHRRVRADANIRHWCGCPGGREAKNTVCALAVTQEDGLCDECREWCLAVDSQGVMHQLASLPYFTQRPEGNPS